MDAGSRLFLRFFGVSAGLHVAIGSLLFALVSLGAHRLDFEPSAVEVTLVTPPTDDAEMISASPPAGPDALARRSPARTGVDRADAIDPPAATQARELNPGKEPFTLGEAVAVAPRFDAGARTGIGAALLAPSGAPEETGTARAGSAQQGAVVRAWLEKHKRYPRVALQRRVEGEATLELVLDGSGRVHAARVVQSSGSDLLDQEVTRMVARANPFPTDSRGGPGLVSYRIVVEFHLEEK
jgi:protein TonB